MSIDRSHPHQESPWRRFLRSLGSSRLLYVLVPLLMAVCALGTILPQGRGAGWYRGTFGVWAEPLLFLQADDAYRSSPFICLLSLLAVNLASCSWSRLGQLRWRPDALLCHAGVLVIMAGGAVSGLAGVRGVMPLLEGQASDQVEAADGPFRLPFALRLHRLDVEHAGSVRVPHVRSELGVAEAGAVVRRASVSVNHPLSWRGYRIYQSGWDPGNPRYSSLLVRRDPGTGVVYLGFVLLPAGLAWTQARSLRRSHG